MIDITGLREDKRPQSSTIVHALLDRLEAAEAEAIEEARLNGMGSEREAALMAKLEAAETELAELRSSMKFRTSLIGRTEAERDAVAQQLVQSEQGKRKISEECDACKAAYNEWIAKTEWVQQGFNKGTISAKYLGLHRADVMARLLDEVKKERDALRAKIAEMEQQEPFAWIVRGGYPVPLDKLEWQLWCGSEKPTLSWVNQETRPLYALPGAKGEEK